MGQLLIRNDDSIRWEEGRGDARDGNLVISSNTAEAPIDSAATATAGTYSISATNASFAAGQIICLYKTRGSTTTTYGTREYNVITAYTAGTITTKYPIQNTYVNSGADCTQVRVCPQYATVTINSGVTYSAKTWNGTTGGILAFFVQGVVTKDGAISAGGLGFRGGAYFVGTGNSAGTGEGGAGASVNLGNANANGNGGGGAKLNNTPATKGGGSGGNATSGQVGVNGTDSNGTPGAGGAVSSTTPSLTLASFGGGGGGSAKESAFQNGVAGGGLIEIFAHSLAGANSISVNGASAPSGGGSGAGGCINLNLVVGNVGSGVITANGGTDGVSAGGAGAINLNYAESYSGTTSPTMNVRQDSTIYGNNSGAGLFLQLIS